MSNKKSPEQLKDVFTKIQQQELILVGGQAVNFWAITYQKSVPELKQYIPYASEDIDFLGGKIEANLCQEILGGSLKLNKDFSPSPNTGVLVTNFENENLRIDFLSSVFGLNDDEIVRSAVNFRGEQALSGVNLKILNPILILEGKLKSLVGLPQNGRQDEKHLKMCLLITRQYLTDLCTRDSRKALKLIERLYRTAKSDSGLQVWEQNQIDISSSVPVVAIKNLKDPKLNKFQETRRTQLVEDLTAKREKYSQILAFSKTTRRKEKTD